ncbi:MAG: enoyl-CoA hydratase/isomerase family protein [Alphaproteobacteria bacterium]|nr:enoyl-CoA hydratase/isomerase family protein [Alphaproteobacteria bacterium]
MSEPVVVVREHGVTHVTLNRPERGNAFALDMVEAALAAVQSAYSDGTRLLVIAGAGKNFCTGLDLGDLDTASDGDLLLRLVRIETLLDAVWCAPCVTMGIGRGRVMGAGADLFTACDRRVAIEGSSYTFPGAVFGVALGTRRLMERIGADLARDMVRSGRVLPHDEALRVGLATIAVPPDAVEPEIIAAQQAASRLDIETNATIHRLARRDDSDADLAGLVRSAARPGLKARILAYRARTLPPKR